MHRNAQHGASQFSRNKGSWNPGTWLLPSGALTIVSIVLYFLVVAILWLDPIGWALFRVPGRPGYYFLSAAAIVGLILQRCLYRPGPWLPRIWLIASCSISLGLAILSLLPGNQEKTAFHALAVGALAASLSLLPRLLKLKPANPWVQRVGPLVLFVLLPVEAYVAYRTVRVIVAHETQQANDLATKYKELKDKIVSAQVQDWKALSYDPREVVGGADAIAAITIDPPPQNVIDGAAQLHADKAISDGYAAALTAVVQGLTVNVAPVVMPPDVGARPPEWMPELDTNSTAGREALLKYMSTYAAVFKKLYPGAGSAGLMKKLEETYVRNQANVAMYHKSFGESWESHWLLSAIDPQRGSLESILRTPVLKASTGALQGAAEAGRSGAWLQTRYGEASRIAASRTVCRGTLSAYSEFDGGRSYTLYCYGFQSEGDKVNTAVILQVDYRSAEDVSWVPPTDTSGPSRRWYDFGGQEKPTRVTYRFPVQGSAQPAVLPIDDLRSAIQNIYQRPTVDDQSGGFWFEDGSRRISLRPSKKPIPGSVEYIATER